MLSTGCWLAIGSRGIVSVQNPVRLTQRSEPQPDFAILRPRDDYRTALPKPADTMLAIEVASTSLEYDRGVKLALYARSGIPEVWIVDLAAGQVEGYRSPRGDSYAARSRLGRADVLTIEAIAGVQIPVAEIFA
jgi:Uma2 family endonuclease